MSKSAPIAQSGIGQLGGYATNESGVHAREYKRYLPSKEELRRKLREWVREVGDE